MTKSLSIQLQQPHLNQQKVIKEAKRFNLLKCGRRFGKSTLSIYKAAEALCKGESVAYFAPTYKDTSEWWNEIAWRIQPLITSKDSTLKQIKTITGGKLDVWSFDNPDSGRGRKYHLVLIDECEKGINFEKAWKQSIRPTLTDYKGSAWFFSTPQFGRTFFKELYNYQDRLEEWKSWKFTTYDNPYIDPTEIDAAKRELDPLTFACEYMADDVDLSNKPFAYCFDKNRHIKPVQYEQGQWLYLSFDFNVDPITCVSSQYINGEIRFLKEFRLSNSNIYELCDQVRAVYPTATYMVTGDASGQARSALTVGNINYYTVIREKLFLGSGQFKVPSVNPAISDSQVLLNSILQNHTVYFDPSMVYTIDDMLYVEVTDSGDIDKKKDKHRSHLLDAVRYTFSTFHKHLIKVF